MKPTHNLIFLLIVLGILTIISLSIDTKEIKVGKTITIKIFDIKDWLCHEKPQYADISHLKNLIEDPILEDFSMEKAIVADTNIVDTTDTLNDSLTEIEIDTIKADAKILKKSTTPLILPNDNPECLEKIFSALKELQDSGNTLVRIMHYGDSQIEGDRISSIFRRHLQSDFGGHGLGLFSAYDDNQYAIPLKIEHEGNWERHTIYGQHDTIINHNKFGMLASLSRFTPVWIDSTPHNDLINVASLQFSPRDIKEFASRNKFRNIKIFTGNNHTPTIIEIFDEKDSLIYSQRQETTNEIKVTNWQSDKYIDKAKIKFIGQDSPDIYGISLEDTAGILVDNIPMRGNSGTIFTKIDKLHQKAIYDLLKPRLIILEFGVNVVPNEVSDYKYYENGMYKQLIRLQEVCPEAAIIVIGVTDMSKKVGTYYESYSNIELIRDAQKQAAQRANCAFWDIYEAMGGHNSMPSWVFAEPALAQKDFTHFTYYGSKIIGDMFYNAFRYEYEQYLNRKK